jgi:protein transport protein DSL1/ZW10
MREDLSPRASGKVRLDSEVELLQKFGKRAYGNEMSTQRIILNDLLGGELSIIFAIL